MKESKESYYEILGLSEDCLQAEIKKAYLDLCKNYHPDKLPSETPEGAKRFIAQRMTLINEAYEVLKDGNSRKHYDLSINSKFNKVHEREQEPRHQEYNDSTNESSFSDLFDQSLLEKALKNLELEESQFDKQLNITIFNIEKKYCKHLKTIKNHTPGKLEVIDSTMRLEKSIIYGLIVFFALWLVPLGSALSALGWMILIVFGIFLIQTMSTPAYRSDYVKEVKSAKAKRDYDLSKFRSSIDLRVNHFKKIPIHSINYAFVKELSSRDRLLLVKALKQREDAEKAEIAVQSTVKVVAAIGLFAIFLSAISN